MLKTRWLVCLLLAGFITACAYSVVNERQAELLAAKRGEFNWKASFVFGMEGDKAVPYLIDRMEDRDINVRANSVKLLGTWLIAPESAPIMKKKYFEEKDTEIRKEMLVSLRSLLVDMDELRAFFAIVAKEERDPDLNAFAVATLAKIESKKALVRRHRSEKRDDREEFESTYQTLYVTYGKRGNYKDLLDTSLPGDEEKLKALRQRILRRGTDDALYAYRNISAIIVTNRMIDAMYGKGAPKKFSL